MCPRSILNLSLHRVALLSLLLLSACSSNQVPEFGGGDNIGEMGERHSESPGDVYVRLAVEYMKHQRYSPALQNARLAVDKDESNANAHNVLALLYDQLGELELANSHFRRALSLEPKNSYYRNAYGFHLCKRKQFRAADTEFQLALRNPLYDSPEVALNNAGVCAQRDGRLEQAADYFTRALQRDPRLPAALLEMAQISFDQGKQAVAANYLRRYHEIGPQTSRSLWLGIRIARAMGDGASMASFELRLRSDFPDSEEYRLLQESSRK